MGNDTLLRRAQIVSAENVASGHFSNHASKPSPGISRRAVLGRLAVAGGAFLAGNFFETPTGKLWAQTTSAPAISPPEDHLAHMRRTAGAVPPVTTKLTDRVYLISGPGGNIGVFTGTEGKVAIDSGLAPASNAILRQIDALGPEPLRILVNTHWHFDHTDGNEAFHKRGALILGHENVRKRMGSVQHIEFFHTDVPASPSAALPESTFRTETTLYLDGEEIRIAHVDPAHTDSDSYIHFVKANVIHAGDLYFSQSYPFIDGATGGLIRGMVKASDHLLMLADANTKIIPGHGPVTDAPALRKYRDMLADIEERVGTLKQQGKDLNAAIAVKPTQKYDEIWGKGGFNADAFTTLVFTTM